MELGRCCGSGDCSSVRVGTPSSATAPADSGRQAHRDGVLGESHDAEAPLAGDALEAFAVEERDHLQIAVLGIGVGGALRQRDFEMVATVALHEHPASGCRPVRRPAHTPRCCRRRTCGIYRRVIGGELSGAQRLTPQLEHAAGWRPAQSCSDSAASTTLSSAVNAEHRDQHGSRPAHRRPGRRSSRCRGTAARGPAPMPSSRPTGKISARFCDRTEQDELEHHAARVLVFGRAL